MGKLMLAYEKAGKPAQAAEAARTYLNGYEGGMYEELARSLLGQ